MTGREFLCVPLIALVLPDMPAAQQPVTARSVVSRADVIYKQPTSRSEEVIPVGNGRMAALVWTAARALRFQINRVDIHPLNKDTGSVDVEIAGAGADVFTANGMTQRLSLYEGLLDVKAAGVYARLLAWQERDLIAIEIVTHAERGRVVILIASATTLDSGRDVAADALANLDAAAARSFDDLAGDNAEWWHDFWERETVPPQSADYHYQRYLMATGNAVAVPLTR